MYFLFSIKNLSFELLITILHLKNHLNDLTFLFLFLYKIENKKKIKQYLHI